MFFHKLLTDHTISKQKIHRRRNIFSSSGVIFRCFSEIVYIFYEREYHLIIFNMTAISSVTIVTFDVSIRRFPPVMM